MASRTRLGLAASLLLITGCFSAGGGSCQIFPPNGLAGNGSFHYECVGEGADKECADRAFMALDADLPSRPIARTARFRLTYQNDPTKAVKAASTNAVSGSGTFTAQRAGTVGFFVEALNGTDDIEEAITLLVADPDSVRIERIGAALLGEGNRLIVGTSERFRAAPFENRDPLVGALAGSWSVEPEGLAEVENDVFGTFSVRPIAAGKLRLTVSAAGFTDTVTFDLVDPSPGDDDAGADADTNADASTDANGDANGDADGGASDASQD
jgi:hypothetical protein